MTVIALAGARISTKYSRNTKQDAGIAFGRRPIVLNPRLLVVVPTNVFPFVKSLFFAGELSAIILYIALL